MVFDCLIVVGVLLSRNQIWKAAKLCQKLIVRADFRTLVSHSACTQPLKILSGRQEEKPEWLSGGQEEKLEWLSG